MTTKRPERLIWLLKILANAKPALVEPHDDDMRKVAHWAWSNNLARRHFESGKITYSITEKGQAMLDQDGGAA